MQVRSEIKGAVSVLGLVAAFLLVAVSIDFGIPGQPLLQTLRFHLAGLLLVAVLVLVAMGSWRRSLVFAIVLGVSVAEGGYFVYRQQEARAAVAALPGAPLLKVLSFNILNDNDDNGPAIAEFIKGSGADVVVIMEASPVFDELASLAEVYPARAGCELERTCDLTLLSKTPLEDVEKHSLSAYWRDRLITAQTTIAGHRITLLAAHMVKPYFDWASVHEAHTLRDVIEGTEGPLVLAGDLNAAAWSDNIEWLMRDAGLLPGPAYPATWPVELGALGVPIDNVFTRAPLITRHLRALDDAMGSNHRALWAEIDLAAE